MKQFKVKIKGLTPYMQYRMDDQKLEEWEKCRRQIIERPEVSETDATRAEYHAYRNPEGQYYIPAEHLRNCMIGAGTYMKAKMGGRSKSMKVIVAATFVPTPEEVVLPVYDAIDKRSTVNRNVKARVIVIRPKWTNWEAEFTLNVYETSITKETVTQLIHYAGSYVGIGSYRPTCNGMFGRFELTEILTL